MSLWLENRRLRKQLAETEAKLWTEIDRNRARESEVLASLLSTVGAERPRTEHAVLAPEKPKPFVSHEQRLEALVDPDDLEFWQGEAIANGGSADDGRRDYMAYLQDGLTPAERHG